VRSSTVISSGSGNPPGKTDSSISLYSSVSAQVSDLLPRQQTDPPGVAILQHLEEHHSGQRNKGEYAPNGHASPRLFHPTQACAREIAPPLWAPSSDMHNAKVAILFFFLMQ
jgi:hypothetical protein